jgi:predicted esterase
MSVQATNIPAASVAQALQDVRKRMAAACQTANTMQQVHPLHAKLQGYSQGAQFTLYATTEQQGG